jgi:hypothetical protein
MKTPEAERAERFRVKERLIEKGRATANRFEQGAPSAQLAEI